MLGIRIASLNPTGHSAGLVMRFPVTFRLKMSNGLINIK